MTTDPDDEDGADEVIGAIQNRQTRRRRWAVRCRRRSRRREIAEARALLGLRPGMTYCELGAASHHMTALGKAVMPGGHVVVTAPNQYQLDDSTRAAKDADCRSRCSRATSRWGLAPRSVTPSWREWCTT